MQGELVHQRIEIMLTMQDAMNLRVHEDWRNQGFPWYRAIWVECAELLDHHGWKWWKKHSPDIEQVKLELVDIWHFGMSHLLLDATDPGVLADRLATALQRPVTGPGFQDDLESFALETLRHKSFDIDKFATLLADVNLGFDELYQRYIGKNVLNFFRQDHGYQDGSYQKNWAGREDNEHLVELVAGLDMTDPGFKDHLYDSLAKRYLDLFG